MIATKYPNTKEYLSEKETVLEDVIEISIERIQKSIDSGFKELPNGLTPEELLEYIMNDKFTNDE